MNVFLIRQTDSRVTSEWTSGQSYKSVMDQGRKTSIKDGQKAGELPAWERVAAENS